VVPLKRKADDSQEKASGGRAVDQTLRLYDFGQWCSQKGLKFLQYSSPLKLLAGCIVAASMETRFAER